jgi:hypothetical protein
VATFLLTYRSFATTNQFFTLLFRRFNISPPPGLNSSELAQWTDRKLTPIRLRVSNIIKSWLEHYFLEDESEDRQMLPKIKDFAETGMMRESMSFPALQLIKLVEKRETLDGSLRKMVLNLSTQAPQPITPRNLKRIKFMDLDPLEFARQLTIMEANSFNRIKPLECLGKAWTSEDPDIAAKAINIKRIIETSNLYANWINELVLNEKEVKKRAMIIRHVIAIAEVRIEEANAVEDALFFFKFCFCFLNKQKKNAQLMDVFYCRDCASSTTSVCSLRPRPHCHNRRFIDLSAPGN